MVPTLLAAVLVGALAPLLRSRAWGVPFSLLSIATVLRSFVGSALTVVVIGSVALLSLRAASVESEYVDTIAGVFGGVVGLGLLATSVRRMRDIRGLAVLCQRLGEEDVRAETLDALNRLFDRVRGKDAERYVAMVLMATWPLVQANLWDEARSRLRSLDTDRLSDAQSVLRNQALATCELQFDDTDAAQAAIDSIQRPTEPSIEVWLVAMEALLMAVRGESEAALAHLGAQDTSDDPSLRASHRLVHAHILAGRGDEGSATEELERLREEAGRAGLVRVLKPRGPASAIAERLLRDEAADHSG